MKRSDIQLMFDYNYWANGLILSLAKKLSHEQLTQLNAFSYGSLLGTLAHTLDAEYVWRTMCQTNAFQGRLVDKVDFPTLDSLIDYWDKEEAEMRAFINSLSDDDMTKTVRYEGGEGMRERVMWHCLWHVVNHGTQHRSECAVMLTDFGQSPGNIDFSLYMNTRS